MGMRIILTFPLMARRPSSQPLTTLVTLTKRITRKYTPFYPCNLCNLCPPILIRIIRVHLCNPYYCGSRRVGNHDSTLRRGGDQPMDTATPKRAFASPTIDNHPLRGHHGPGRFRRLKRVSRNITRSRGICIIAWDGFRGLKRISSNISHSRRFAS